MCVYVCICVYIICVQGTAVTTYEEVHHHERHEDKDADGHVRIHEVMKQDIGNLIAHRLTWLTLTNSAKLCNPNLLFSFICLPFILAGIYYH
jgi:hypothetical protein